MKVFSFCLYGTERNYYEGLLENIQLIRNAFPDFSIYVYKGVCDPTWVLENVTVIETQKEGAVNMMYRYLPLTFADVGFVRDADSRVTERDQWAIREFLSSNKSYHIIRDHGYHKSLIMGGLFGWKKSIQLDLPLDAQFTYGSDEAWLASTLYPRIIKDTLVHTNLRTFHGEDVRPIPVPQKDLADFIGNVIWNGVPKFKYTYDVCECVQDLAKYDQFVLIKGLTDTLNPMEIPYEKRSSLFDTAYISNFYLKDYEKAQYWLRQFEFAELTEHVYNNAKYLFPVLGKTIVASFDPSRVPAENELVIVYGNYPDWSLALPGSNKLYRHPRLFAEIQHDSIEYHSSWEPIDAIYVLNLEERRDRFYEILLTLCSVHAPLHRIYHYKAKKGGVSAYVGATQNHVDVIEDFCKGPSQHCLILEDDFTFLDDRAQIWASLSQFFERKYVYSVCFLGLSKTGQREPYDDLLSKTLQSCTTSSAYILQKSTSTQVLETIKQGLALIQNGNHNGCIDRYWSRLTDLYFFKVKLGYQRPSYSNLLGTVSDHFD